VGRKGHSNWIIHKGLDTIRRMEYTQSSCTHKMARNSHTIKRGTWNMAPLASRSRKRRAQAMENTSTISFGNKIGFDNEEISQYYWKILFVGLTSDAGQRTRVGIHSGR